MIVSLRKTGLGLNINMTKKKKMRKRNREFKKIVLERRIN